METVPLVQNCTSVLYFLYMAYVLKVQSLCTKSTKPLYKMYMGVVQKLYKYHRVVFYSLWANKANLPYLFPYLSGEPFYLTKQT